MEFSIKLDLTVKTSTEQEEQRVIALLTELKNLEAAPPCLSRRDKMKAVLERWVSYRPDLRLAEKDSYSVVICTKQNTPVMYLNYHRDYIVRLSINKEYIDERTKDMSEGIRFYNTVEISCDSVEDVQNILDLVAYP